MIQLLHKIHSLFNTLCIECIRFISPYSHMIEMSAAAAVKAMKFRVGLCQMLVSAVRFVE